MKETWPTKRLGDICQINPREGKGLQLHQSSHVSFVAMSAIDENAGVIARPEVRTYRSVAKGYTSFRDNDVLFAKITPCMQNGKVAIARKLIGGIGFGSTEFHVLRPGPEVLPEWIFAFVRHPAFRCAAEANFTGTAGQQRVPTNFMANTRIPVPPLGEQNRIVAILEAVEELRRLREQSDRRTADIIPALFDEMFGDPATNPLGWPKLMLGELGEIGTGSTPSRNNPENYNGTIPWVKTTEIKGSLIKNTKECISEQGMRNGRCKIYPKGSIVIAMYGQGKTMGKASILGIDSCTNQACAVLKPSNKYSVEYVLSFLHLSYNSLRKFSRGGNQPNLNLDLIRKFMIPYPPMSLQEQFAKKTSIIRDLILKQEYCRRRLDDLFQSLLNRAFLGKL